MPSKHEFRRALTATLPVLAGYLVLGMGFGIILRANGYGVLWALAMSVCIYAGSMQYVAINLITGGAGLITTALTTLMVNIRHLFYGISMVDKYRGMKKKPFLIFALTDETYSLVCGESVGDSKDEEGRYYFLVSLFNYLYWIAGSVIGSLLGAALPFSTEGIDFALTALFLTVFVEQWLTAKKHAPAIIGVLATLICLIAFGSDDFLIFAMLLIAASLALLHKKEGDKHE